MLAVVGTLISDILLAWLDPRIRLAKSEMSQNRKTNPTLFWYSGSARSRFSGMLWSLVRPNPNIDKLAQQGLQFNRALLALPNLHSSSSVLLTGHNALSWNPDEQLLASPRSWRLWSSQFYECPFGQGLSLRALARCTSYPGTASGIRHRWITEDKRHMSLFGMTTLIIYQNKVFGNLQAWEPGCKTAGCQHVAQSIGTPSRSLGWSRIKSLSRVVQGQTIFSMGGLSETTILLIHLQKFLIPATGEGFLLNSGDGRQSDLPRV